jgi:regulator of sigma E protease
MQLLGDGRNLLLIILGFGLLIAVHELGHFLAARWARIRVDAFAIGMGPAVLAFRRGIGWRAGSTAGAVEERFGMPPERVPLETLHAAGVGETEYGLRLLPLGGFVRMKGQEDLHAVSSGGDADAYGAVPVWKRMVVVSAGVIANLVLAVLLYVAAFLVGVRFESPTVGAMQPAGPAAIARSLDGGADGLRPGDRITMIDGSPVQTFADVQIAAAMSHPGASIRLQVDRPGVAEPLAFELTPVDDPAIRLRSIGIMPARDGLLVDDPAVDPFLAPAVARSGLAQAGVGVGWSLTLVDGVAADTLAPLQVACEPGKPVSTVWRGPSGERATAVIEPLPPLQILQPVGGGEPESGLLGLVPLTRIDWVRPGSINDGVLRPGDVVLAFAGERGPGPARFRSLVRAMPGRPVTMQVLRAGTATELRATVDASGRLDVLIAPALDLPMLASPVEAVMLDGAETPTPAAALELGPLATIESVQGIALAPGAAWADLIRGLQTGAASGSVQVQVRPWQAEFTRTLDMPISPGDARALAGLRWTSPLPAELFDPVMTTLSAHGNPLRAAAMGFRETGKLAVMTWLTIDRLVRGSVPVEQLRGPVGIVHVGTRVADRGFMYLVFFLAMISVNLAVLNFLPLPIVDGGLFLFLVYEALRGRPPSVGFQNAATLAGLLLIGSLFVVTFYNDVMRLMSGG